MIPYIGIGKRKYVFGLDEDTTVWKKAIVPVDDSLQPSGRYGQYFPEGSCFKEVIVKLTIPKDATVLISNYKCRASYAKVEGIYKISPYEPPEPLNIKIAYSYFKYPFAFLYQVGETVYPSGFDLLTNQICSYGIHFFRSYADAVEYDFS